MIGKSCLQKFDCFSYWKTVAGLNITSNNTLPINKVKGFQVKNNHGEDSPVYIMLLICTRANPLQEGLALGMVFKVENWN